MSKILWVKWRSRIFGRWHVASDREKYAPDVMRRVVTRLVALAVLLSTFIAIGPSTATASAPFIWFNPAAGMSTAPGAFTPLWSTVSDGTPILLSGTYDEVANQCSSWTQVGSAVNGAPVTLANDNCYKWTFDNSIASGASAPSRSISDKSQLTSPTLKVFSSSCLPASNWSGDQVTITYNLPDPTSGIDCKSEFTTPKNVGKVDLLVVGGGGAGGWASATESEGGGGGGGGGMSFSRENVSVTPGRTYPIQVGAGAIVGTKQQNKITCLRGNVGDASPSVRQFGGTSLLGVFNALGGGCAKDTGGNQRGSDGGISANGRTGGRGGACDLSSRPCDDSGRAILDTTTYYTTAPHAAYGLSAYEGGGGGGGAGYSDDPNSPCNYAEPTWDFYYGCDGWDIGGIGAFGGQGGKGIQSTWYQGACNYYYGGGGGGGGSTPVTDWYDASNFGLKDPVNNQLLDYAWNGTSTQFDYPPDRGDGTQLSKSWMPVGGPGGVGGGGQAATSTINWSDYLPISINGQVPTRYISGQNGTDGCGGGGGGGQTWKSGVYLSDYTWVNLADSNGNPIFQDPSTSDTYTATLTSGSLTFAGSDLYDGTPVYYFEDATNPGTSVIANLNGGIYTYGNSFFGIYDTFNVLTDADGNPILDPLGNPEYVDGNTGMYYVEQYDPSDFPITLTDIYGNYYTAFQNLSDPMDVIYSSSPGYFNSVQSGYISTNYFNSAQVYLIDSTADNLDKPGKGGNGIAAIRFRLSGVNYSTSFNPALSVPQLIQTWPTNSHQLAPIQLKQQAGSVYVCLQLANPTNHTTPYGSSSSLNFTLGGQQGSEIEESGTASSMASDLRSLNIRRSTQDFLIRDKDAWVRDGKVYILVRVSGSDQVSMDSCDHTASDLPVGGTPLQAVITLNRMPATLSKRSTVVLKSGSK